MKRDAPYACIVHKLEKYLLVIQSLSLCAFVIFNLISYNKLLPHRLNHGSEHDVTHAFGVYQYVSAVIETKQNQRNQWEQVRYTKSHTS